MRPQRDVDATMATMVARPYVNHVPTMTGGVGHDQLKRFYKYHFIGGNPADTELKPVSRTVAPVATIRISQKLTTRVSAAFDAGADRPA